jgi:cysteine synthase
MGHLLDFVSRHSRLTGIGQVVFGLILGISASLTSSKVVELYSERKRRAAEAQLLDLPERPIEVRSDEIVDGVSGLIGAKKFLSQ